MQALVVHPGTQHAFRLAAELNHLSALSAIHTGFAIPSGGKLERIFTQLPHGLRRLTANRRIENVPLQKVHLQTTLELLSVAKLRCGMSEQRVVHWRNEQFQQLIPTHAIESADVVVGFDTSSWILVQRCQELGKPLILVQTIGHPDSKRTIYQEIHKQFPEWQELDQPRLPEVRRAEQIEHEGATLIVGSSSFTQQSLIHNGVEPSKIRVIPHGVDSERFSTGLTKSERPIRFVFAGSLTARKGIPLLLEAWRRLAPANAELWLVGPVSTKAASLIPSLPGLRYLGAVPQDELPGIFGQCDVFVFPSYFEGFGLVILQAMACGLPVITTTATAGPDLIQKSDGGWVISPGDVDQLVGAMRVCLDPGRDITSVGRAARRIAEKFNWQVYGQRWVPVLEEAIKSTGRERTSKQPLPCTLKATSLEVSSMAPKQELSTKRSSLQVLLAHPGTQYSGRLASQLERRGALSEFYTCLAFSAQGFLARGARLLPNVWRKKLANRCLVDVPSSRLATQPYLELSALLHQRCGYDEQHVFYRRNAAFQKTIPDRSLQAVDVVIGFDTSSWILGKRARELNRAFCLDQSIGHPRAFAQVAAQLEMQFPDWSAQILCKSEEDFAREAQEHALATRVIVPSQFVAKTLIENGVDANKIRVNPFGVDLTLFKPDPEFRQPFERMRFVFAGSLLARKGLPLLLDAWCKLPLGHSAELWLVGSGHIPKVVRDRLPHNVRFLGRLTHEELTQVFQRCHIFVFPSYFEGLAQVQLEAAACGLPIIGTESSGSEEIVRNGETGFILPTGDLDSLYLTLLECIRQPDIALAMRAKTLAARDRLSWDHYGSRWFKILNDIHCRLHTPESASIRSIAPTSRGSTCQ